VSPQFLNKNFLIFSRSLSSLSFFSFIRGEKRRLSGHLLYCL
jgi:hypothetical protein